MKIEADAILFDSDGVLVDSHHEVERAWRQLAGELDLHVDVEALLVELVGVRAADTLGRHLPPSQVARAVARLEQLEVQMAPTTRPVRGALELLTELPSGSWTIVTSASRTLAQARWSGAGIPVPDAVVTAEGVVNGKPDPEPFTAAARLLGVDPGRCVVFEDSPSGGTAAAAAGAAVVAVGDQPWTVAPLARIADLSEVAVARQPGSAAIVLSVPAGGGGRRQVAS